MEEKRLILFTKKKVNKKKETAFTFKLKRVKDQFS